MSVHFEVDELADAAAGVLEPERTQAVVSHVDQCPRCRQVWTALAGVSDRLAAEPRPSMPTDVASRLGDVLTRESRQRASAPRTMGGSPPPAPVGSHPYPRQTLGSFGSDLPHHSTRRLLASALVACGAAGVVGFAGYFLSASAGLNEPAATAPAALSSARLGSEASSLAQRRDLSPHRFSDAWRCARRATEGRITGLTPAVVDGRSALLVYTRSDEVTVVTVVRSCEQERPQAGPSTTIPR